MTKNYFGNPLGDASAWGERGRNEAAPDDAGKLDGFDLTGLN